MLKKKIKMRIALILCVALMAGIVDLPGNCPASGAAQLSGTAQGEVQEFETPPGGLETVEVHHVTDLEAVQRIPSYETAASVFSLRSQTVFDSGTGAYGYQHLDAAQQEFYEAAEVSLKNFRADAEAEFIEIQGKYTPFRVSYDRNTLTDEKMIEAWMAFRADHPWLFWFSNVFGCGSQGSTGFFIPYVGDSYKQGPETLKAMEQTITDGVQKYLDAAGQADSKYEKVRIIYNEIINDINYAYKDGSKTPEDSDWAHSIVGVFDASYKKAVCEGYAKAFCFILNILDIPNVYVTGDAGGGHAWNAVSFDGGNTYYYMDSTWDDQGGSANSTVENTYRYFAMPKDAFEKKHTPDKGGTGVNWQYDLPVMGNNMDYTYYVRYHCYGTSDTICDQSSAEEFLKAAKVLSPQENCLLLLEDTSMLTTVVKALGVTESISYLSLSEYDMILYTTAAENFTSKTPATAIAFSDETVCVDVEPGESKVQTLLIGAVTADSDDYITFYSTDEDRVVVKTPYVKAREGECVEVVVKDSSAPVTIFAKSAAGGAKASCTITTNKEPEPTTTPTAEPTAAPTAEPTAEPTATPTAEPTATPTAEPTATPTATPTAEPTATPTAKPTATPTAKPTATPTAKPTATPTAKPTATPTAKPTVKPTATPTAKPTEAPIIGPTIKPTSEPIVEPTEAPIIGPTIKPTSEPIVEPTEAPIIGPTIKPTSEPTVEPTEAPIIGPTIKPTAKPTATPTVEPTEAPTIKPTSNPPIIGPTIKPTSEPIVEPTEAPTVKPTTAPIIGPTIRPTETPTVEPTTAPIIGPTVKPTSEPIVEPTEAPTVEPTTAPIIGPTIKPTSEPIVEPTEAPIIGPTIRPTEAPTVEPTTAPIIGPTIKPGEGVPVVPEPTSAVVTEPSVSFNPVPVASSKPVLPDGGEDDEDEYDEYDEDEDKHDIEKGDEIKVGSLKYRVTKIKGTKGELAVVGVKSKNITSIVIPKKVSKEGISFTVTSIYKNAFKGCRKVKLLTIKSKDITNIAKKAFAGLSKKVKIKIPKAKSKVYKKLIKRAGFKLK